MRNLPENMGITFHNNMGFPRVPLYTSASCIWQLGNTRLSGIYLMESETRNRLGVKDDDIDVDHYFLPGGILDTHHEEDMIGGSLLDEIGGAGNVKAVSRSPSCSLLLVA